MASVKRHVSCNVLLRQKLPETGREAAICDDDVKIIGPFNQCQETIEIIVLHS